MTGLGTREADVRGNVHHVLEVHHLRSNGELVNGVLNYILTGSPTNIIEIYRNRLVAEEYYALSVLCLAVDASLDGEQPLAEIRARLDEVREQLVEVRV